MKKGYLRNVVNEAYAKPSESVAEAVISKFMETSDTKDPVKVMSHLLFILEKTIPQVKTTLEQMLEELNKGR